MVAALALASLLLAYEYQRAAELGDRVETLQGALETARDELGVHRERMALVKTYVDDLSARLGALAGLVADDAAQSPDAGGPGSDSDSN